jgi:hypothetical protein
MYTCEYFPRAWPQAFPVDAPPAHTLQVNIADGIIGTQRGLHL